MKELLYDFTYRVVWTFLAIGVFHYIYTAR